MAITALRTVIIYVVLAAAMRVMGKRQIGDLQPIELVVTLLIADMAASATEDTDMPLASSLIPIFVLVSLELLISGLTLKSPKAARLIAGHPVVLIREGVLDQHAMRQLRLTLDDVTGSLRQQGIFDLDEIYCAIVETSGNISVMLKSPSRPATAAQVGAAGQDDDVPFVVVSDGQLSRWGLEMSGQDEQWLHQTLKKERCHIEDIFLLTADKRGRRYLIKKEADE